jgi:metallo-beta-lactamase family protein
MHLVEDGTRRFLLDCGKVQGLRDEVREQTSRFPFDPATIDAVILSHAHVDHCGNLPVLVREGFSGPIYCTPATRELLGVVLADSARIHEEDARVAHLLGRTLVPRPTHISHRDVAQTLGQCVSIPYDEPRTIASDVQLRLVDAGHVLGSAMVQLSFSHPRRTYRIGFTGDLGRRGLPFLRDAQPVPECDLLLSESTYGGRRHDTCEQMRDRLAAVVQQTAEQGGKVLLPAFSLGRTQLVLYYVQTWMRQGILPRLPIYVDSPMARLIAGVCNRYPESFQVRSHPDDPPLHYIGSVEESRHVSQERGPALIIASGGMCDGGRISQHLRYHIDDPRACLVLVSYQAPCTLGSRLLERGPTVRFHGQTWNKWLRVEQMNGFSGHADHDDLLHYLTPLAGSVRQLRLVHGEPEAGAALLPDLRRLGFEDADMASREQTVRAA